MTLHRTVHEIEADLRQARLDVFSPNCDRAVRAELRRLDLLAELAAHPDEVKRRANVAAAEAFMNPWA